MQDYNVNDPEVQRIVQDLALSPKFTHNSATGVALEDLLANTFEVFAMPFESQALVANPFDPERPKKIDLVAFPSFPYPAKVGVEAKSQEKQGTTGEKLGTTSRRLSAQVQAGYLDRAYIVLNGQGWDPEHIAAGLGFPNVTLLTESRLAQRLRNGTL